MPKIDKRVLLLAGEESGAVYARRIAELLRAEETEVRGYDDYGFKTADLAVFGIWAVVRRIFYFLKVARTMKQAIREWKPHAVVTIDYPGMNLKLAAYAKSLGIPAIHIVCPQVWAWHQGRIPKVAASLSELLCFFPFEPKLFDGTGLEVKFIGHPLVGMAKDAREKADGGGRRVVAMLPGSRMGEVQRILPRLLQSAAILAERMAAKGCGADALEVVIPAANEQVESEIRRMVAAASGLPQVSVQSGGARDLLRRAECAAVASGTATLEAALAGCPTVLVYAVSPLLAWILRRAITGVRHAGLANIIAEKCGFEPPMPELLQEAFTPEAVASQLEAWLMDADARKEAKDRLDFAMEHLQSRGEPLKIAADEIYLQAECRRLACDVI